MDSKKPESLVSQAESIECAIIGAPKVTVSASLVCAFSANAPNFKTLTTKDLLDGSPADLCPGSRYRGVHILLDYSGFQIEHPQTLADWTLGTMRAALKANDVRCLHSHSVVFEDVRDAETPPGFTAVCLLEQSHLSARCDSASGMLAVDIDVLGCDQPSQTFQVARDIHLAVMSHLRCRFEGSSTLRFPSSAIGRAPVSAAVPEPPMTITVA